MPSPAKSPSPSRSSTGRHAGEPASGIVHVWPRDPLERVPSGVAVRIRRVPFIVWFIVGLVVTRIGYELGIIPPLDWLPGEPRR